MVILAYPGYAIFRTLTKSLILQPEIVNKLILLVEQMKL